MRHLTSATRALGTWTGSLFICLSLLLSYTSSAGSSEDFPDAPDFDLPIIANAEGQLSLESLRGSVTYLDFWASWCGPCRLSLPALDALYQELAPEGLKVVAVSVDVVEEDALDFLKRYAVSYPVVIDTEGEAPKTYDVGGMPSGYLIDRDGRVRSVHVGFKRGDEVELREEIKALLAN